MLICTERRGLINMRINEKNYVDKAEKVISDLAAVSVPPDGKHGKV